MGKFRKVVIVIILLAAVVGVGWVIANNPSALKGFGQDPHIIHGVKRGSCVEYQVVISNSAAGMVKSCHKKTPEFTRASDNDTYKVNRTGWSFTFQWQWVEHSICFPSGNQVKVDLPCQPATTPPPHPTSTPVVQKPNWIGLFFIVVLVVLLILPFPPIQKGIMRFLILDLKRRRLKKKRKKSFRR